MEAIETLPAFPVKILFTEFVTHDVKSIIVERPQGYMFTPGQATEVSVNQPEWVDNRHPFTFTSFVDDPVIQFTIKGYPERHGVTEKIHSLKPGDELVLHDVWGTITYQGSGVFIAAGAGVTPFIGILRHQHREGNLPGHQLLFANKTADDIIREPELTHMFKDIPGGFVNILSREQDPRFESGHIDKEFLQKHVSDFRQHFYVCGPKPFVAAMKELLGELGASLEAVVFEK